MLSSFPVARYRFTVRMHAPLRLPEFAGSLLRGQFGSALRRVSCMTGEKSCQGCPMIGTCPYPAIFETPAPAEHAMQRFSHVPNPYVIEPPERGVRLIPAGDVLQFSIVLIGRALTHLSLVSQALQRAMEEGLGRERARGALESIEWQGGEGGSVPDQVTVWRQGDARILPHPAFLQSASLPGGEINRLDIRIYTPMRLQTQGRALRQHELVPRKFIADLLRRITLLAEFHAGQRNFVEDVHALVLLAEGLAHQPTLRWLDWSRYSSRQRQEMTLGGVVGTWSLEGDLAPLYPWLWLGQWLHVGKNTTMGLGGYSLHR